MSPRSTLSFITPMNSLWLRQLSPSMSNSLKMVSRTLSERSWPVAIFTARLNWTVDHRVGVRVGGRVGFGVRVRVGVSLTCTCGEPWRAETLPIPMGRWAAATSFTEKAKSSRLLVKRQNALNSSKVMLCKTKPVTRLGWVGGFKHQSPGPTWPAGIFLLMFSQYSSLSSSLV